MLPAALVSERPVVNSSSHSYHRTLRPGVRAVKPGRARALTSALVASQRARAQPPAATAGRFARRPDRGAGVPQKLAGAAALSHGRR